MASLRKPGQVLREIKERDRRRETEKRETEKREREKREREGEEGSHQWLEQPRWNVLQPQGILMPLEVTAQVVLYVQLLRCKVP